MRFTRFFVGRNKDEAFRNGVFNSLVDAENRADTLSRMHDADFKIYSASILILDDDITEWC